MKKQIDEVIGRILARWVAFVIGRARRVCTVLLALTLLLLGYAALDLGIDSDNVKLLGENLPSRRALDEFSELFPILNNALLIVIDARSPELARDAAADLAAQLERQPELFHNVYIPGGGEFFEHNGLLYRSVDDLYDFTDNMARVQPMISALEKDPSVANLAAIVQLGLESAGDDLQSAEDWATILDRLSDATSGVFDEFPVAISWEEFLLSGSSLDVSTRRVLMVEPVLDFESFLPASTPLARIRATAKELGFTPERGVTVRITGNPALNYEEMIGIAWDIVGSGVVCFVFVAFVLYFALRSARLAAAALVSLLVGLVWTAAFAAASIGHLNLLSLTFAVLFIGLGVDFAIHLGMSYADLRRSGRSHEQAMLEAVDDVGSSLVLCTLTTSIGFYVFVPTDHRGVAELGLISGTGMLIILFQTLTLFPALLSSWLHMPEDGVPKASLRFERDPTLWIERHGRTIRWSALALGVLSVAVLPRISFEPNVVHMRNPETESVQAFNDIASSSERGSPWYANSLAPDLASAGRLAERYEALDLVSHTITLLDFVPEDQDEKREILSDLAMILEIGSHPGPPPAPLAPEKQLAALRKLRDFLATSGVESRHSKLLESVTRLEQVLDDFIAQVDGGKDLNEALATLEQVLLGELPTHMKRLREALEPDVVSIESLPPPVVHRMLAPDGRARVIVYPKEELQDDPDALERFVDAVQSVDPDVTGMSVNMVEFGRATIRSLTQALISAFVAIALLLWVLWRRVTEMLLVLVPLCLGALLTAAAMVAFGVAFNFANVIVIPLLLGIGVDSGIHLVHRADAGPRAHEHLLGSTTARAIFYSAATTTASFGALAFSSHRGIASLGIVLVMGLVFTLLCTLVVLPALIAWRQARQES